MHATRKYFVDVLFCLQQVKGKELKAQAISTLQMMHKQVLEDCEVRSSHDVFCKVICCH